MTIFTLQKGNANKITQIEPSTHVVIPRNTFAKGDALILFNNSDDFITLESKVEFTYVSGTKFSRTMIEWPPRALINVIFVDDNVAVTSVGVA